MQDACMTFVNQYGELDEVDLFSRLNVVSLDIVRVEKRTLYAMAINDQLCQQWQAVDISSPSNCYQQPYYLHAAPFCSLLTGLQPCTELSAIQ
jgi:hypothetical protein